MRPCCVVVIVDKFIAYIVRLLLLLRTPLAAAAARQREAAVAIFYNDNGSSSATRQNSRISLDQRGPKHRDKFSGYQHSRSEMCASQHPLAKKQEMRTVAPDVSPPRCLEPLQSLQSYMYTIT